MLKSKALLLSLAATVMVASPVIASDTLKVGVQAPITGSYANEGQGIDQSVRLLADQINAKGGVLGKKIEVVTCDDEGTAMKAAICAKDLVNKKLQWLSDPIHPPVLKLHRQHIIEQAFYRPVMAQVIP